MEKRFNCDKNILGHTRITFWVYAICIPIIVFLWALPSIQAGQLTFNPIGLIVCGVILICLIFAGYRAMRVMNSVKNSYCVIDGDRVYGLSTPDPFQKAVPFEIQKSEILGIGKTTVSAGGMRSHDALVINTEKQKIVLLGIERMNELKDELNS